MGDGAAVTKLEEVRQGKDARFCAAETIIAAYDLASLRQRLEAFPDEIAEYRRGCKELRRALKENAEAIKEAEARLQVAISVELDDRTGKPRFSNEGARAAELTLRKRSDADCKLLCEEGQRLQEELDNAEVELEKAIRRWKAMSMALSSMEAELRLLAS